MEGGTRLATHADVDGVTATLTAAFATDPLWTWAFPEARDQAVWWRYCIASAFRYPGVWISGEYAAVSVWIPPGGVELTEEEQRGLEPLIRGLIGARCDDVMELLERFETSHPQGEPHYYLSLLGTHPDRRGEGLGMALLTEIRPADDPSASASSGDDRKINRRTVCRARAARLTSSTARVSRWSPSQESRSRNRAS